MQLVHELLRFNTLAIYFWLNRGVLLHETRQYTKALRIESRQLAAPSATVKVRKIFIPPECICAASAYVCTKSRCEKSGGQGLQQLLQVQRLA